MSKKEIATQENLFAVLDLLDGTGIRYWLDGGWGVDALVGRQTRSHRDVDIDFDARYTEQLLQILKEHGFEIVTDWSPVRLELYHPALSYIDIHPFFIGDDGTAKQADLEGGWYQFEADFFGKAFYQGREIPCISAKGQSIFHTGYELRDVDRHDIKNIENVMNKTIIETQRLTLIPLDPEQLALWVTDIPRLEEALHCRYQAEPVEGLFKEIAAGQLEKVRKDRENYIWHTFWLLIRKSDQVVVGSADFKDVPNDKGQVEIGYGLGKAFEHNGYMTEAAAAMCHFALAQKGVKEIVAETDLDGCASQRILHRCGFTEYSRGETLWWRLQ